MRQMFSKKQVEKIVADNVVSDLVGKDVEVNSIQANEVLELNDGISFTKVDSNTDKTFEYLYVSAYKIGKILKFVIVMNITLLNSINNSAIGRFTLPQAVRDKLIPTTVGTTENVLAIQDVLFSTNGYTSTTKPLTTFKRSDGDIGFNIYSLNSGLTTNTKYYVRAEVSFLLSDNMASA